MRERNIVDIGYNLEDIERILAVDIAFPADRILLVEGEREELFLGILDIAVLEAGGFVGGPVENLALQSQDAFRKKGFGILVVGVGFHLVELEKAEGRLELLLFALVRLYLRHLGQRNLFVLEKKSFLILAFPAVSFLLYPLLSPFLFPEKIKLPLQYSKLLFSCSIIKLFCNSLQ